MLSMDRDPGTSNQHRASDHLIVIIGFDAADSVRMARQRFKSLSLSPDVLVIENGRSTYGDDIEVVYPPSNVGYCGAANLGITKGLASGYRSVTIANYDIEVTDDAFRALTVAVAEAASDVAVIGGIELDPQGTVTTAGGMSWSRWTGTDRWRRVTPNASAEALFAQGAFVTFTPAIAKMSTVFDESLFMFFDEVDLGLRVRKAGLKTIIVPGVTYTHDNSDGRYRPLRGYLMWRNRSLTTRKQAGAASPVAHFVAFLRLIAGVLARAPHFRLSYTRASLRGFFDGIRGITDLHRVPGIKYLTDAS